MNSTALRRATLLVAAVMLALVAAAAPAFARRADPKWYQVRAAYQGQPEYLYEIADRFLGDGDRFTEIFALNKGRVQADGLALTDPQEIETGWILLLPPDAKGDGVETGPLPTVSSAPPPPSSVAAATTTTTAPVPEKDGSFPTALAAGAGVGAGLLIVAGAVVLVRRRRRTDEPTDTLTAAADWTIDRALRGLAASGRPAPRILGAALDDREIRLRLAAPDSSPVAPWKLAPDGRTWIAALPDLRVLPSAGETPSPYPLLITLGTAGGTRELIDLGHGSGVISVDGDDDAAREVAAAWAGELVSSPWSSRVRVVTGGLAVPVAGAQLTALDDIPAALELAGSFPGELGVLILGGVPDEQSLRTVVARGWTVIVVGDAGPGDRRFTALPDGRLDAGALGFTVDRTKPRPEISWER